MLEPPDHNHKLSRMLSEVLQDIGVTETLVKKRRRMWMINEAMHKTAHLLLDEKLTSHFFGSQSEASTTLGLKSDLDRLTYHHDIQVIQDMSQWQRDITLQYLMVQDETVSPGHCLLQWLRRDAPLPVYDIQDEYHSKDSRGRVLLSYSFWLGDFKEVPSIGIHGPARSCSYPHSYDGDMVLGLYCPSWPEEAIPWLQQHNISGWPSENMKTYSADQGCFVVPVGSKKGLYKDLEWRISTFMAERCLMNNLNMTQIRCYILMKMVLKTFLKPICGEAVSSFMCKNILFHSIAGSEVNSEWNEGSLLTRLNQCLQALLHCIQTENCPHFVIPRNNLLAGKLSSEVKRQLADVMCTITGNIEQSLMGIQIDDLGLRLHEKLVGIERMYHNEDKTKIYSAADYSAFIISHRLIDDVSATLLCNIKRINNKIPQNGDVNAQFLKHISKWDQVCREATDSEKVAVSLLIPFLYTTIGSIQASADIQHSRNISPDAQEWFSWGLNSDVSSSRLKLASAQYCSGDLKSCEMILATVSEKLSHKTVQSACSCYIAPVIDPEDFGKLCYEKNEDVIKHNMAFCVTYMPCEINCIPGELKYEMFRSTEQDHPYRDQNLDNWMDLAVVDSKPYLYFLQYKVYSQLQRPEDQHRALDNLARTISKEPNLGHRETALNLLGQCMEQENRPEAALYCYQRSLTVRGKNNAAKWHVCRLLEHLVRNISK